MIVGIDGSNLRSGGGLTHLVKLLAAAEPGAHGIDRVVVWASRATLAALPVRPWLEPAHQPALDRALPWRLLWQRTRLAALARRRCDVLFVPGGNATARFAPLVTMSRNMLPFELRELARYGATPMALRLLLLRWGQARTLRRAAGVVFLTAYARAAVTAVAARGGPMAGRVAVIPHGVDEGFRAAPRPQEPLAAYGPARPYRLLYVSIVDEYKHQDRVAEAVHLLRAEGLPVTLDFVGPAYPPALRRFRRVLAATDPAGEFLRYRGPCAHGALPGLHRAADLFVFASSCENMPNILLEAMAAGLPIACARRGPMPEILGDAGVYFDPERPAEIAAAVRTLAADPALRARCAAGAYARAAAYTWERCARETFAFVAEVAGGSVTRSGG